MWGREEKRREECERRGENWVRPVVVSIDSNDEGLYRCLRYPNSKNKIKLKKRQDKTRQGKTKQDISRQEREWERERERERERELLQRIKTKLRRD